MRKRTSQLHKEQRKTAGTATFRRFAKRTTACLLAAALLAGSIGTRLPGDETPGEVYALKDPMFKLSAAKKVAVSKSDTLDSLDIQVSAKQAAMQSAVKSLREKERDMATIRWSPLLNIKFPTKPNEEEAFTFQFKPTQMQYQINILKHKENDEKLKIYENVSNTYITIITAQQALKYDQDKLKKLSEALEKLKARQVEGSAKKEAVDKAQEKYDNCETAITNDKTQLERGKQKLSEQVGMDVTTGYRFEDAFVTANLNRDFIPLLQSKAVEKDQGVYEATVEEDEALLSLRINYSLMKSKYGGYMNLINPYIEQALNGSSVNKKAFKKAYDEFTKKIDERWQGSYKILFISIPKEWLKGDLDGVRYVEDDPYVLYTAALDYESARKECENTKKELRNSVSEGYDNYAQARKGYINLNKQVIKATRNLSADLAKNLLGELTDEEYQTEEQELESMRSELNDALSTYSSTLYEFDRTCCGAVSQYLNGSAVTEDERGEGLSSIIQKGVTYTIRSIVQTEEFLLSLNIPDDFEAKSGLHITQFALYSDGRQIGQRTQVGNALRHLSLSMEDVGKVTVRIYNGDTFLDECEIDPTVYIGDLNISTGFKEAGTLHAIGKYGVSDVLATDTLEITFTFDQDKVHAEYPSGKDVEFYNISTATGSFLRSEDKIPIDEKFTYMSFIKGDIADLVVHLYDDKKEEIGTAIFSETTKELIHETTEEEAKKLAEQKAEEARKSEENAKEEEAQRKAQERREQAIAVLNRLKFDSTKEENITYAISHIRELTYAADLADTNASMQKQYQQTKQNYEAGVAQGMSDKELQALQKRMQSYAQMYQKQKDTLDAMAGYSELKRMNGQ